MTITLEEDKPLRHLAAYLMNGLNDRHQLAVATCWDYDNMPDDPSQYPALIVHKTEAVRVVQCRGAIKYILWNQLQRRGQPELFSWVDASISELLTLYEYNQPLLTITNLPTLTTRYRIGQTSRMFPFLEFGIEFTLKDFSAT